MLCSVLTASRSKALAEGLTYDMGDLDIKPGMLVRIPLVGKTLEGIVLETDVKVLPDEIKIRKVIRIESDQPVLSDAQLTTMHWMAEHYRCDLRRAATVFLPPLPWSSLLPKIQYRVRLKESVPVRSANQKAVIELLANGEAKPEQEVLEHTGVSDAILRAMVKNGILERQPFRTAAEKSNAHTLHDSLPVLNDAQQAALKQIQSSKKPTLLFGITGSGKTAVYAHLIAEALAQGKQSILLLPEILLSEELLHRFESLIGRSQISIIHSRLTLGERRKEWKRIANGEIALVIGSRSALFSPCHNLGAIIVDEEHEWTYKNEQTPRYHVRETAEVLAKAAGATLVFGSATPSLDAWNKAKDDTYQLAQLPERYGNQSLPAVRVVDLGTVRFSNHYPFSPPLIEAINDRLARKEQCILFLNRRGMATSVLCLDCRKRLIAPESKLPFTVHNTTAGKPVLVDHATGTIESLPAKCPSCDSPRLLAVGAGTQKIEVLVKTLFPAARTLRADRDTLQSPEDIRNLLAAMRERKADILLGTQSVVKGLDLPGVTLSAVLLADVGLSLPHFRAGERVFQLLTQLTGRSGRAAPGEVIIQTFSPDVPEVKHAAAHTTEDYLEAELSLRKQLNYPPFGFMARLIFQGPDAEKRSKNVAGALSKKMPIHPHAAPTFFGAGKIWHVLLRSEKPLTGILTEVPLENASIDIDPVDCL